MCQGESHLLVFGIMLMFEAWNCTTHMFNVEWRMIRVSEFQSQLNIIEHFSSCSIKVGACWCYNVIIVGR